MTTIWLGSQQSLHDFQAVYDRAHAAMLAGAPEPGDVSSLQTSGPVAVLGISGPLSNQSSLMAWFMGFSTYPTIRNDLIEAAQNKDVREIVLNFDTPGGAPAGLADLASLVRHIDKNIKPVYAYASGSMTSAAYWLGSAARKVLIAPTAVVGSIGTIATHMDVTKQLDTLGVTPTVLRDGPNKALVSPYEVLSADAKAEIQHTIKQMTDAFETAVASYRKVSKTQLRSMSEGGKAYVGKEAVDIGLADGVSTLDTLVAELQKSHRQQEGGMKTKLMTPEAAALALSGVPITEAVALASGVPSVAEAQEEGATTPTDTATQISAQAGDAAQGTPDENGKKVTALEAQLASKDAEILRLSSENGDLQARLQNAESNHKGLRQIAVNSIRNLQIGLGSPVLDTSGYPDEALVQLQASLQASFVSKFPVGGAIPNTVEDPPTSNTESAAPRRLHAVRL